MKNFLALEKTRAIIMSLLMITFGILFVALPNTAFDVVVLVLGWIFIAVGLFWIVSYFTFFQSHLTAVQFVNGMLFVGMGLLLLLVPSIYIALIGFVLAFVGIQYVGNALEQKRSKVQGWWHDLVYGIVEFLIGAILVVLRYTSVAQEAIMIYLGISLIVDGLFVLVAIFIFHKAVKEIKKEINQ